MEVAEAALIAFSLIMAGYGAAALLATWQFTHWLRSPLFGQWALLGRAEPTRANRTIMALWLLLFGARLAASVADMRPLSTVLLFAVILAFPAMLSVQFRARR